MAMLRHRSATASTVDARLLLSARSLEDVLYREELGTLAAGDGLACAVHYRLTRRPPADWGGFARRIDAEMLTTVGPASSRASDLRMRPVRVRRAGCRCPRPARSPHRCDPNRAVRPHGLISDHSESVRGFRLAPGHAERDQPRVAWDGSARVPSCNRPGARVHAESLRKPSDDTSAEDAGIPILPLGFQRRQH